MCVMHMEGDMRIEIVTMTDISDCGTCGTNYDEGGYVLVDGKEVFRYEPVAACWGNAHYESDDLLHKALEAIGITVTVDGERPYALYKYNEDA